MAVEMLSIQQLALFQIAESAARLHCREYNLLDQRVLVVTVALHVCAIISSLSDFRYLEGI